MPEGLERAVRWIVPTVILLGMVPVAHAGRKIFVEDGVEIEVILEPKGEARHGYGEYVFLVTNTSERTRRISIKLPAEGGGRGESAIREISRGVEVESLGSATLTLYQPAFPHLSGFGLVVQLDGKSQEAIDLPIQNVTRLESSIPTLSRMPGPSSASQKGLVLVGPSVDPLLVETLRSRRLPGESLTPGGETRGSERTAPLFETVSHDAPMRAWSNHWLGYSRYDGVILASADLAALPESHRPALWQYVECGGVLMVVGDAKVAEGWKPQRREGFTIHEAGFGYCLIVPSAYTQWSEVLKKDFRDVCTETASAFQNDYPSYVANQLFPIIEEIGVPIRGLFVLMVVFVIVIGPVNLALLSRWKRRLWMLWTVPVISGVTVAAVFGYMLLAEGWDRHQRTELLTIKDETTGRATSIGWAAFYCPVTPGDGLHFSPDTELTLQGEFDNQFHYRHGARGRGSRSCNVNWTRDQHLEKGWMRARLPTHFQFRKSEPRRERVIVRKDRQGAYTATNALGVAVKFLHFADEQGRIHTAVSVPAGGEQTLKLTDQKTTATRESLRRLYTGDWFQAGNKMRLAPESYLSPLTYLAEVEETRFLEEGLANSLHRRCKSLILGILKELEHES